MLVEHVVVTCYFTKYLLEIDKQTSNAQAEIYNFLWAAWSFNILSLAHNRFMTNFRLSVSKFLKVDVIWKPVNALTLRKIDVRETILAPCPMAESFCSGQSLYGIFKFIVRMIVFIPGLQIRDQGLRQCCLFFLWQDLIYIG